MEADDWLWSARLGALEAIAAGTTTIGDNTDAGVTMAVAAETGLRAVIYQEVFGIDHRQPVADSLAGPAGEGRRPPPPRLRRGCKSASPPTPFTPSGPN